MHGQFPCERCGTSHHTVQDLNFHQAYFCQASGMSKSSNSTSGLMGAGPNPGYPGATATSGTPGHGLLGQNPGVIPMSSRVYLPPVNCTLPVGPLNYPPGHERSSQPGLTRGTVIYLIKQSYFRCIFNTDEIHSRLRMDILLRLTVSSTLSGYHSG